MSASALSTEQIKENIRELIVAAEFCVNYRKKSEAWNDCKTEINLGFPGAISLLMIIDIMGCHYRDKKNFKIIIDGKEKYINGDSYKHFYILNSKLFDQNLTEDYIHKIHLKFKSYLLNDPIIGKDSMIIAGDDHERGAFMVGSKNLKKEIYVISLMQLLALVKHAIEIFLAEIENTPVAIRQVKKV